MRWSLTARVPSGPLGIARIIFGAAVLLKAVDIFTKLHHLIRPDVLLIPYAAWIPSPSRTLVGALLALWIVGGLALMLGWLSRISAVIVVVAVWGVFLLDQQLYSNHYFLLAVLSVLFALSGCGAAWSLDARLHGRRATVAAWPVILLKVQLSIVYGFAALAKLNAEYLRGDVLEVYLVHLGPGEFPEAWETAGVLVPLAVTSVAIEAYLAVGFWLGPRARWAAVGLGAAFHTAIVATMRARLGLTVFSLLMFALYPLFFPPDRGRNGDHREPRPTEDPLIRTSQGP